MTPEQPNVPMTPEQPSVPMTPGQPSVPMTPDEPNTPMKRRSFFTAVTAGLAALAGLPILSRSRADAPADLHSATLAQKTATRVSIHPLAVPRNEENVKHG